MSSRSPRRDGQSQLGAMAWAVLYRGLAASLPEVAVGRGVKDA